MDKITQADRHRAEQFNCDLRCGMTGTQVHNLAGAFAAHRLATRTDVTPVAWMPMESAPKDEQILATIKVLHKNGQTWWERHIIVIDSETGMITDMDFHHGWEAEDYEFWQPLPAAPDHIEEPRAMVPATDVAALVEAVSAYRRLLLPIYMSLAEREMVDEPLSDDAVLFSFMGSGASDHSTVGDFRKADELALAALAPFTKGQDDE